MVLICRLDSKDWFAFHTYTIKVPDEVCPSTGPFHHMFWNQLTIIVVTKTHNLDHFLSSILVNLNASRKSFQQERRLGIVLHTFCSHHFNEDG